MFNKINKYIYTQFNDKEASKDKQSIDVFYPSQASCRNLKTGLIEGTCSRAIFYKTTRVPISNPILPAQIRKLEYGKKIEDYEIEKIKEMNICVNTQTLFELIEGPIKIRGKIDAIIQDENEYIGLEYKSSSGYYFVKSVYGSARQNGFPKLNNLMQAMIYIDALKKHDTFPIKSCYLMYIDRDSCTTKSFKVELDDGYPVVDGDKFEEINILAIYERYKYLFKHLSLGLTPIRDFRPEINLETIEQEYINCNITKSNYTKFKSLGYGYDIKCGYCEYRNKCINDK